MKDKKLTNKSFSWSENGVSIWFYINQKQFNVPDDIVYSIRQQAVRDFKHELKELLEPR